MADLLGTALGLLGFYVFGLLLIAVHEAGHLAAGTLCRFRFSSLRVGPILIKRAENTHRTRQPVRGWRKLFGGAVLMFPSASDLSHISLRYTLFVLGGPLANALCAAVAFPFALQSSAFGGACRIFVLASAGLVFVSLIPGDTRAGRSDGGKLYDLAVHPLRRKGLLGALCLPARIRQIQQLAATHRHAEALALLDEQIELANQLLRDGDDAAALRLLLSDLRSKLALAQGTCQHDPVDENASAIAGDHDDHFAGPGSIP
ncbi:MAG TPA: site-2 protease family protein [Acidobacteriaceae bacterium]